MTAGLLEKLFLILDASREAGQLTELEMADTMVLLSQDLPRVDPEVRGHVVMLHVNGGLINVYGPLTDLDASNFIQYALANWGSDLTTVLMERWPLTSPAVGNVSSVDPSTPVDSDIIDAMGLGDNE